MNIRELAWAAGLFEGEGSVHLKPSRRYPAATLEMTDEDTVRRFHAAVGLGHVYGPRVRSVTRRPMWAWSVSGFEKTQALLALLWYGLGVRRRSRWAEVLTQASHARLGRDPVTGRLISVVRVI